MSDRLLTSLLRVRKIALLLALSLLCVAPVLAADSPRVAALHAGWLLDVRTGAVLRDQIILVREDRIAAVGPATSVAVPAEAERIDLGAMTVLPGLFDVHTHLIDNPEWTAESAGILRASAAQMAFGSIPNARATLEAGFTSVRDLGPRRAFLDVALRDAIDKGVVAGPRIQASGAYVTISGGAGDLTGFAPDVGLSRELRFGVADGPDEVRKRVHEIIRNGADVIKVLATGAVLTLSSQPGAPEFTFDELRGAVEEAGKAGLRVAAHAHGPEGAMNAVRAGAASIEHGSLLNEEGLQLMKQHETFLVPTIYIHEYIMTRGKASGYPAEYLEKERISGEKEMKVFRRAVELGVRIAYGTDAAVCPHGENGRQFAVMVEHGMSRLAAVQSATINAAELMGWSDRAGSLEAGKWADLIAVRENPLENIRALENVAFVMKGGKVYKDSRR